MVEFGNAGVNEKDVIGHRNSSTPALVTSSVTDLEAARSRTRPNSSGPLSLNSRPGLFHPNGSAPASVTSLPVQGIEAAPTHRRRRNRRRRHEHALGQNGTPGTAEAISRRANSMPVNPVQRGEAPVQPLNWRKGFDTLLKPQKKIVVRPNLTKCFSKSNLCV
jgi:hypothetical protein